jgi:hypothetical protein
VGGGHLFHERAVDHSIEYFHYCVVIADSEEARLELRRGLVHGAFPEDLGLGKLLAQRPPRSSCPCSRGGRSLIYKLFDHTAAPSLRLARLRGGGGAPDRPPRFPSSNSAEFHRHLQLDLRRPPRRLWHPARRGRRPGRPCMSRARRRAGSPLYRADRATGPAPGPAAVGAVGSAGGWE